MDKFSKIVEKFKIVYKEEKEKRFIENDMLVNWGKANEKNLHSRLQAILIKSGNETGFLSVPEVKIRQEGTNYGINGKRKQHKYKTDVGFYYYERNTYKLAGISEIFTLDMVAHLLRGNDLKKKYKKANFATSADKILHLLKKTVEPIGNILLTVVSPENVEKSPSYPDLKAIVKGENGDGENVNGEKNFFKIFSPYIKDLEEKIKKETKTSPHHVIITEDTIKTD